MLRRKTNFECIFNLMPGRWFWSVRKLSLDFPKNEIFFNLYFLHQRAWVSNKCWSKTSISSSEKDPFMRTWAELLRKNIHFSTVTWSLNTFEWLWKKVQYVRKEEAECLNSNCLHLGQIFVKCISTMTLNISRMGNIVKSYTKEYSAVKQSTKNIIDW